MSAIVKSLSDIASSIVELVVSLFTTAGHLAQDTFQVAFKFFNGALNLVIDFFKGLVELTGGIVGFVLGKLIFPLLANAKMVRDERKLTLSPPGNIAILAVLSVGTFAFLQYQRKQGNTVKVGNKKLN